MLCFQENSMKAQIFCWLMITTQCHCLPVIVNAPAFSRNLFLLISAPAFTRPSYQTREITENNVIVFCWDRQNEWKNQKHRSVSMLIAACGTFLHQIDIWVPSRRAPLIRKNETTLSIVQSFIPFEWKSMLEREQFKCTFAGKNRINKFFSQVECRPWKQFIPHFAHLWRV